METSDANSHSPEIGAVKVKHDWYQTETYIVVTILAKNSESVKVEYTETSFCVSANLPNGNDYILDLDLNQEIIPDECTFKVVPSKIEVKLKKKNGYRWTSLESQEKSNIETTNNNALTQPPKYPSSSKKSKDWDKVEEEIKKQEALERPEGEDGLNQLFQQIYGKGSDEVRRAMNKSYLESGGTVLSTNWSEVGQCKVERKPPDGLEWKSWDK